MGLGLWGALEEQEGVGAWAVGAGSEWGEEGRRGAWGGPSAPPPAAQHPQQWGWGHRTPCPKAVLPLQSPHKMAGALEALSTPPPRPGHPVGVGRGFSQEPEAPQPLSRTQEPLSQSRCPLTLGAGGGQGRPRDSSGYTGRCPSVWEGGEMAGQRRHSETAAWQTDGRTSPREGAAAQPEQAGTLYATRAGHRFPSPRGGGMCFSISNMSL